MSVAIEGQGLHTAAPSAVRFTRRAGPVTIEARGVACALKDLRVVDTTRSTTVASADGLRVATVEHVFAAFAGLGLHDGVGVVFEGPEVPLVDGASFVFASALAGLGVPRGTPSLRVVRAGTIEVGASVYEFFPVEGEGVTVEVMIDFGDPRLAARARWDGDPSDFLSRIASARTFGFEHEVVSLLERGLASHVSPSSVVVIGKERILSAGAPFEADEPARHKLLDLMGDLYVHGGPPVGAVRASRPGHAATHEVVERALAEGLLALTDANRSIAG